MLGGVKYCPCSKTAAPLEVVTNWARQMMDDILNNWPSASAETPVITMTMDLRLMEAEASQAQCISDDADGRERHCAAGNDGA